MSYGKYVVECYEYFIGLLLFWDEIYLGFV